MALMAITRQGLAAMAVLVAILWGCLYLERSYVRHAAIDQYKAMRQIRDLRLLREAQPVAHPAPAPPRPAKVIVG